MMFFSVFSPIGFHNLLRFVTFCRILRTSSFPVEFTCQLTNYFGNVANLRSQKERAGRAGLHRCFTGTAKCLYKKSLALQGKGLEPAASFAFP
jgi:hypothetical protein